MLTIYRVEKDYEYQYFLPENPGDTEKLITECLPKKDSWSPVPVYNRMPLLKAGDFYHYDSGCLIANANALKVLGGFFGEAGEVLPLHCEGETFWLINVLNCVNCLNRDQTEWDSRFSGLLIKKHMFYPSRLPFPGLFKIPESRATEVLVYVNSTYQQGDDFKYRTERYDLKGIRFEKIWESEE